MYRVTRPAESALAQVAPEASFKLRQLLIEGGTDGVDVAVSRAIIWVLASVIVRMLNGPDGRRLAPVVLIGFQRDGVAADGGDELVGAGADGGGLVALFAYFLIIGLAA